MNNVEVGKALNLSYKTIQRIEKTAIQKIKNALNEKDIDIKELLETYDQLNNKR